MTVADTGAADIGAKVFKLPGPVITWVGEMPWTGGIAFGDEDGRLRYSSGDRLWKTGQPMSVIKSDQPINQVAFNIFKNHRFLAACTTSNIAIREVSERGDFSNSKLFDVGGHGVYPTQWGGFLVPQGPGALAAFYANPDGSFAQRILKHKRPFPYYYSMCRVGLTADGEELWACAGRSGGLLAVALDQSSVPQVLRSYQSPIKQRDYVSVSAIGNAQLPFATISLSRDRQVDFSENLIEDRFPLTWHAPQIQGVAYSLVAAEGHLYILTSTGVYVGMDIVNLFLTGKLKSGLSKVRYLPSEAVDFALFHNRWLMILKHNAVLRIEISRIAEPSGNPMSLDYRQQDNAFKFWAAKTRWDDTSVDLPEAELCQAFGDS
jgi:hypothetical protein